jgi:hypothetical protein
MFFYTTSTMPPLGAQWFLNTKTKQKNHNQKTNSLICERRKFILPSSHVVVTVAFQSLLNIQKHGQQDNTVGSLICVVELFIL